jgi:hypothetical protein
MDGAGVRLGGVVQAESLAVGCQQRFGRCAPSCIVGAGDELWLAGVLQVWRLAAGDTL